LGFGAPHKNEQHFPFRLVGSSPHKNVLSSLNSITNNNNPLSFFSFWTKLVPINQRRIMGSASSTPTAAKAGKSKISTEESKLYPVYGRKDIMSKKKHGTSDTPVQLDLRWNCNRNEADKICNFNRHGAEWRGTKRPGFVVCDLVLPCTFESLLGCVKLLISMYSYILSTFIQIVIHNTQAPLPRILPLPKNLNVARNKKSP
jgi:hypothetical protein